MDATPVVKEVTIDAPAENIWEAITSKEKMKEWYFDVSDFKPEVGFRFQFTGGDDEVSYVHHCEVKEVIPGKKLGYSWRYEGIEGDSYVTFELFPEGSSTRVKLTHTGIETFATEDPRFRKESFTAGWNEIIGVLLKNYAEGKERAVQRSN
jgi:uncharacterized protein YndB with AHSA1/START domain